MIQDEVKKMIVIYHDVGGTHSTAVAAHIHINTLSPNITPTEEDLLALPTFDSLQKCDQGRLLYIGTDEFGCDVYTVSRQYKKNLVIPAIIDMYNINNGHLKDLYVVDTSPTVNTLMKIGGFSSRRLHLVKFGRPIVTRGTIKAYNDIVKVVTQIKSTISKDLANN